MPKKAIQKRWYLPRSNKKSVPYSNRQMEVVRKAKVPATPVKKAKAVKFETPDAENLYEGVTKPCTECKEPIPFSAFGWPDVCSHCNPPAAAVYKECSRCNELKIPESEPSWKTVCTACYLDGRDCKECGQKISPNAPKFARTCHSCFMEKRSKTHAKCSSCKGEKANHLRRLKSQPFCNDCMQNLSIFKKPKIN